MSFGSNESNQAFSHSDNSGSSTQSKPRNIKQLLLLLLLVLLFILAVFSGGLGKYVFSFPKNAYKNYVIKHAQHFAVDYVFKQALPGKYSLDVNGAEIDPRATHLFIAVFNNNMEQISMRFAKIDEMKTQRDGSRVYSTVFPKETEYLFIYFQRQPDKDEFEPLANSENFMIATNHKIVFFDKVRGESKLTDKPEYNVVYKVKTYNADGRETKDYSVGSEIYAKVYKYTVQRPKGIDSTVDVSDMQFAVIGKNKRVISEKPRVTRDYLIFSAVGPGKAAFTFFDAYCTMKNLGEVNVGKSK